MSPPSDLVQQQALVIGKLRNLIAQSCIRAIRPGIVILDEFQRFKSLLAGDNEVSALAHHLFNYQDGMAAARVILLSATPYKMYTMSHETEDDHQSDFLRTLEFLAGGDAHILDVGGLPEVRFAAGAAGHAFLSLFNTPEATALIRSQAALAHQQIAAATPYWEQVLNYSAADCLQAVVDEYLHGLHD